MLNKEFTNSVDLFIAEIYKLVGQIQLGDSPSIFVTPKYLFSLKTMEDIFRFMGVELVAKKGDTWFLDYEGKRCSLIFVDEDRKDGMMDRYKNVIDFEFSL